MLIYGLDPGTTQSALVAYDSESHWSMPDYFIGNDAMLELCYRIRRMRPHAILVIEQIESMGMAVGKETFETVFWSGRFFEAWGANATRLTRRAVKLHLCGSMRAKDANIRQALLDKFGGDSAIGKKATPGPLYGLHGHGFAALAVAVTWWETIGNVAAERQAV